MIYLCHYLFVLFQDLYSLWLQLLLNYYQYVKPASDFTRTVGIESIIPAMYQAYEENTEIYFKDYLRIAPI